MTPELSIVIPTYNEAANVAPLLDSIARALPDGGWEIIFVDDDSGDGTGRAIFDLAARDARVRLIRRIGRRGLSSACIEGMLSSSAPYLCVMDADLQHDPALLPALLARLRSGTADIVIGSRYVESGSAGGLGSARLRMSRLATRLSHALTRVDVRDPMSGFFMLRREFLDLSAHRLSGRGFKILLDLLMSAPRAAVCEELPYRMRPRVHGESKLSTRVLWDFLMLLADKLVGRFIPARFIAFVAVGASGLVVQMAALWLLHRVLTAAFLPADALAVVAAMISNFILNNLFTYRDRRLRGAAFFRGLLSFCAVCGFGAFINVALAAHVFALGHPWWLAGFLGAVAGAVWNYAITAVVTWPKAG